MVASPIVSEDLLTQDDELVIRRVSHCDKSVGCVKAGV